MTKQFSFHHEDTHESRIIEALSAEHAWASLLDRDSLTDRWTSPWWLIGEVKEPHRCGRCFFPLAELSPNCSEPVLHG